MARPKKIKAQIHDLEAFVDAVQGEIHPEIALLTQEFGNGDLNVLRDKINEIIAKR
jgi:hypothetical protein